MICFAQDFDNVQVEVVNNYAELKVQYAIAGETRTDEQIYIEIATGQDYGQYASMNTKTVHVGNGKLDASISTGCQNIDASRNGLKNTILPMVREDNTAWYVTKDGQVFNATGYVYDEKTYWTASYHTDGERPTTHTQQRPETIANAILNHETIVKTK